MKKSLLEFPTDKLFVVDFLVEDETTTDSDLVNYYYQLIEYSIPRSTLDDSLCKEFILTFSSILSKTSRTEDKKKIFVQYYRILAADAAYRSLLKKVSYYLH